MNLVTSAQTFPDQTAQRMDGQVLTYAELEIAYYLWLMESLPKGPTGKTCAGR